MIRDNNGSLEYCFDNEKVRIEAWGKNALRVRATKNHGFSGNDWALDSIDRGEGKVTVFRCPKAEEFRQNLSAASDASYGEIQNGKIMAYVNSAGVITYRNQKGNTILKENYRRLIDETGMALNIPGREFRQQEGENYHLYARFLPVRGEKIFGMGQYQQHELDMKGCVLELAQRNSQASVPFYISSLGYGFLWNNPAVGRAAFANNGTEWEALTAKELDYLIIAGDSPAEIEENYMSLTGLPPMMPEYAMGFWQSKLRYRTQKELLYAARKYKELGIPLDVIVCDFFHWTQQGEYKFDQRYWPDPEGMIKELDEMGIKLMVSVWPTVDVHSENYSEMLEKGYLVQTKRGVRPTMLCGGEEVFYDATNPEAGAFVWSKIRKNYWDKGVKLFWLDVAEPEYTAYDYDNYNYSIGSVLETGNIYPKLYLKTFYDGMKAEGEDKPICLVRCAWAGSAKYGGLVWSGDIKSSFESLQRQIRAGLSMAIAGIPWWTTDIGGFNGGVITDPHFRELFVRWFEYGCFCPVMRLHGNRLPMPEDQSIGVVGTGAENEVWSFGENVLAIARKYIQLREKLRNYIRAQMNAAHKSGTPVMRPLFYDFPEDEEAWKIDDSYMFGPDLLVSPVADENTDEKEVYLPKRNTNENIWINVNSGDEFTGGSRVSVKTPIDEIPVFVRKGSDVLYVFRQE